MLQGAGAAAKERAPSVGSIFCGVGGSSRVLLFVRETVGRFGFDSYKFTDVRRRE